MILSNTKLIGRDMTTGSATKLLITFSIPFMAANALQMLFGIINMTKQDKTHNRT
ncbi:MAG: hypothetical protein LBD23_11900 [Oscillospiraceae bacterium]|jgi:Na+-driven multidrug efflux pump|nr:hypothetical protein [Oscillospiraceae bacterium]